MAEEGLKEPVPSVPCAEPLGRVSALLRGRGALDFCDFSLFSVARYAKDSPVDVSRLPNARRCSSCARHPRTLRYMCPGYQTLTLLELCTTPVAGLNRNDNCPVTHILV